MGVRLPTHRDYGESTHQNKIGGVSNSPDCTESTTCHVVPGPKRSVHRHSHSTSRRSRSSHAVAHKGATWKAGVNATARMDLVQQAVTKKGFSGKVAELVSGPIRPGTAKLYDVKWKAFCNWCDERRVVASEVSTPCSNRLLVESVGVST